MNLLNHAFSFGAGAFLSAQITMRVANRRNPRPMPHQFASLLDHPWRLRYRNPSETLGAFHFQPGDCLLDLGCGVGTFTEEMARMVGSDGCVHAVDIQAPLLEVTRRRLDAAELGQRARLHHPGAHDLPLADESVDLAVLIASLAQMPNPYAALREVWRVLRPGGRIAVSEELPDPAYVPAGVSESWLREAGFLLLGKTGTPFCYSVVASKYEADPGMG